MKAPQAYFAIKRLEALHQRCGLEGRRLSARWAQLLSEHQLHEASVMFDRMMVLARRRARLWVAMIRLWLKQ